jgi:hypothetical protein
MQAPFVATQYTVCDHPKIKFTRESPFSFGTSLFRETNLWLFWILHFGVARLLQVFLPD